MRALLLAFIIFSALFTFLWATPTITEISSAKNARESAVAAIVAGGLK